MNDGYQVPSDSQANLPFSSLTSSGHDPGQMFDAETVDGARRFGPLGYAVALVLWLLIFAYVGLRLAMPYDPNEQQDSGDEISLSFSDQVPGMTEIGLVRLEPDPKRREQTVKQLEQQESATPASYMVRLSRTIVSLEMDGASRAIEDLQALDSLAAEAKYEPTAGEARHRQTLERLYRDVEAGKFELPSITSDDRADLKRSFGWHGALALEPAGGANASVTREQLLQRAVVLMVGLGLLVIAALLFGVTSLCVSITSLIMVIVRRGWFKSAEVVSRGTVYLETFVVWLLMFIGASLVVELLVPENIQLYASVMATLSSMLALGWPVIRGVPLAEVKRDIGWQSESLIKEVFAGVWGYLTAFPIMFVLMVIWAFIMALVMLAQRAAEGESVFAAPDGPGHPIQEMVADGNVGALISVAILAVVLAPLIEETFFRGVLYRHLREITSLRNRIVSSILSAVVTGFIFAAIHPQGIMLVPPLGMLGFVFAIIREWRGSLFASMTAHALHNGMLITVLAFLVRVTTI